LKGVIDEEIIASVRGFIIEDTAYIGMLMVKQEFQNRKYGQLLIQAIETSCNRTTRHELFMGNW
jgi:GNAT superfamily N-acetyltransferase